MCKRRFTCSIEVFNTVICDATNLDWTRELREAGHLLKIWNWLVEILQVIIDYVKVIENIRIIITRSFLLTITEVCHLLVHPLLTVCLLNVVAKGSWAVAKGSG